MTSEQIAGAVIGGIIGIPLGLMLSSDASPKMKGALVIMAVLIIATFGYVSQTKTAKTNGSNVNESNGDGDGGGNNS